MATKRPEIELEVSCGGTFRIATEEMACRITVLDPGTRTALDPGTRTALTPAPADAPAPPPSPAPAPAAPPDPFYQEVVERFLAVAGEVASDLASRTGETPGAGAEQMLAGRHALGRLQQQVAEAVAALPGEVGTIQSQVVNVRFALSFLKNHPLFGRRRQGGEEEITVSRDELDTLAAKITEALALIRDLSARMDGLKNALGGGGEGVAFLPDVEDLAGAGQRLFDGAFLLAAMVEAKKADTGIAAAGAAGLAEERLASALATAAPEEEQGGEEEMSDDEALKKLAEFGLA